MSLCKIQPVRQRHGNLNNRSPTCGMAERAKVLEAKTPPNSLFDVLCIGNTAQHYYWLCICHCPLVFTPATYIYIPTGRYIANCTYYPESAMYCPASIAMVSDSGVYAESTTCDLYVMTA